jgi:hypothetical protein
MIDRTSDRSSVHSSVRFFLPALVSTETGVDTYTVYGVAVATNCTFGRRLRPIAADPDLEFICGPDYPLGWELDELPMMYESEPIGDLAQRIALFVAEDAEVLRMGDVADYVIGDERIECHLHNPELEYLIEIHALGIVLAYWLERQGSLAVHASGVVVGGGAIGILAPSEGGKTTLAAALLRAGHSLLADDLLAIEETADGIRAHPGFPQMRMWPDDADYFVAGHEHLEFAHPGFTKRRVPVGEGFGAFHGTSAPLSAIYVPERRPGSSGGVVIEPVRGADGVRALLRAMFTELPPGLGDSPGERLRLLAGVVAAVPVKRLSYPNGRGRLDDVVTAIEDDCANDE